MKKVIFLALIIGFLVFGINAFALDYSQIDGTSVFGTTGTKLNGSTTSKSFGFGGINNKFSTATLTLNITGSNFTDYLKLGTWTIATISDANLVGGVFTYNFTGTALANLNNAISNRQLLFSLLRQGGTSTITSAKLSGSLAPEPISMALMGAGIVALPFARRLKKSFRKEA